MRKLWLALIPTFFLALPVLRAEEAAPDPRPEPDAVFISGTIQKWDQTARRLSLETYLNESGNPAQNLVEMILTPETEILSSDAKGGTPEVHEGQDVDAEFDPESRKATYLFIYS